MLAPNRPVQDWGKEAFMNTRSRVLPIAYRQCRPHPHRCRRLMRLLPTVASLRTEHTEHVEAPRRYFTTAPVIVFQPLRAQVVT